ncbi:MAG: undecaprenyl-diphosphate phosphatase [Planctomycetota bacterium]|nr:undecaprenyl-diphosphate phosphatase [Planctomycetota bacterium]
MSRRAWLLLVVLALGIGVLVVALAPSTDARDAEGMSLWQAAVLGTVEGLTEYLPVSSTGHLLVTQRLMGIGRAGGEAKAAADAFAICIQLGAILAVLALYFGRVRSMVLGLVGRDAAGSRLLRNVLVAFLPAAVIGLLFSDAIKEHLFGPWPVVLAWAVGGAAILVVSWRREGREMAGLDLAHMTLRMAFVIGVVQCVAMWPGVSRSLVTIVGGVLAGLSLAAAVEFSFLLGLLTLSAATLHDGMRHGSTMMDAYSPPALVVGLCFAFVSALLAVHWMVAYLQRHGLAIFGWYRLAMAVVVATLLLTGVLV